MPTNYHAGPEVFVADTQAVMPEKRRLAHSFGFDPTGPDSDENSIPVVKLTADTIYGSN